MLLLLSLQVFSLVLLEKKIVMQSRDYSALTASILSLTKGSLSCDVRKLFVHLLLSDEICKLFSENCTGVPALLPCILLSRQAKQTSRSTRYFVTYYYF